MEKANPKFMPAVWGGVLIGVISGVPVLSLVNCACCMGVIGGGILSVYLYKGQLGNDQYLFMRDGVALGLMAGFFGAVISGVLQGIFGAMTIDMLQFASRFYENTQVDEFLSQYTTAMAARGFFVITLISSIFINCTFGLLGGVLGVAIFGKAKMV